MTTIILTNHPIRSRSSLCWNDLKPLLVQWRQRIRSRWELQMRDGHDLLDIGLTRMDAQNECDKPF
jgi:uncharacterized protein YjiS (DUF1127 family)